MKLGSVISSLAQSTIHQLCRMLTTAADVDTVKHQLAQACSVVQQLYHGNAEICQVSWCFVIMVLL